jgi:sugar O-acyltransferase (sialic acid O-acetyltransferase NeuD family)
MTDVIVLGAAGTALDVLECLEAQSTYRCLGFLDDDAAKQGTRLAGLPVLGPLADASRWPRAGFVDALGSPASFHRRPSIIAQTAVPPEHFITVIHPRAVVSARASIGPGSLVYPNVVIGPNARLGMHVTVLANTVVNHDAVIGDWTILASGVNVSGRVRIGDCCYLGTGSVVIHDGAVGDGALIGMGAVVTREVASGSTVVGNPAHPVHS